MTETFLSGGRPVLAAALVAERRVSCREERIETGRDTPVFHGVFDPRILRPFLSSRV